MTYQITPENGEGYGEYVDIELESTDFEQIFQKKFFDGTGEN